jgi:hypothetical protein
MRRTFIIMLALGTVLALATPVAAKPGKGGGHGPSTHEYQVTMSGDLATTCSGDDGSIVMTGSLDNVFTAGGVDLDMNIPIAWWRDYPEPKDGDSLTGCHGLSQSSIDFDQFGGALWLTFLPDNEVRLHWLFDYYWDFDTSSKHPKQTVLELFSLDGVFATDTGCDLTDGCEFSDTYFVLKRFVKDSDHLEGEWETEATEEATEGTSPPISFTLTVEPAS